MSTHATTAREDGSPPEEGSPDRRFDGPWLRILAITVTAWVVLYGVEWLLLEAGTPAGAAVGFTHAYVLAPLATATVLLDALSLGERGIAEFGLFKWIYALVALIAPPIAVIYYAHREWLTPDDADLLDGPEGQT